MNDIDREVERRRLILVEDEAMSRTLLTDVLTGAGFEVEACANAKEALRAFKAFDPDGLVTDIDLGGGPSGLDLVVAMAKMVPYLAVVILSNYSITPDYRHEALGRAVYLRKQDLENTAILIDAIESALHDRQLRDESTPSASLRLSKLTGSQVQLLRLIAEGYSNEEIARRRETSVKSVEHMTSRIFATLGLASDSAMNSRVSAVRIYIEEAGMPSTHA